MILALIEKSIFLAGNILFLVVCDHLFHIRMKFPLLKLLEQLLTVILLSRWAVDFLRLTFQKKEGFPPPHLLRKAQGMIRTARYFSLCYITAVWLMPEDNLFLAGLRILFTFVFFVEIFQLKKRLKVGSNHISKEVHP